MRWYKLKINKLLKEYWGYDSLKPKQKEIIYSVINNEDTIALLPTGFGKSLCFQLPAIYFQELTIVVSPLIALMHDQVASLIKRNIPAVYIDSTLDYNDRLSLYDKIKNMKYKIIYVSPERLETNEFLDIITSVKIDLFVVDEAHTICWADGFREAYGRLYGFISKLNKRPVILALTATATLLTLTKITTVLHLEKYKLVSMSFDRKNIFYKVVHTKNKIDFLLKYINDNSNSLGIIYCLTIRECKEIYKLLLDLGYSVGVYYGSMDKDEKQDNQNKFIKHKIKIMICTNAFGMGIDIPDIRYVINYSIPSSIEDFAQQSGRCSRDGKYAEAIVLFDYKDVNTALYLIDSLNSSTLSQRDIKNIKKENKKKLDAVIAFSYSRGCLHKFVVNYFMETHNGKCMMCSNCKKSNT